MYRYIGETFGLPAQGILREEMSATTVENALFGAVLVHRTNFVGSGPASSVGVLSNLYHVPSALVDFQSAMVKTSICGVFAEDWVPLLKDSAEWIQKTIAFYSVPHFGRKWNASAIGDIMEARRRGDLSTSVGSLVGIVPCLYT